MRFSTFDLIIEAKRWDAGMQNRSQWEKEFNAYISQYGEEKVPVMMIALGGIWKNEDDEVSLGETRHPVHMCKWEGLLAECQRMKKELENLKYPSSQILAWIRTLMHLIDVFAWHGFQTGIWFAEVLPRIPHLGPSIKSHHRTFRNIIGQLSHS
jgi:hypothetical protein